MSINVSHISKRFGRQEVLRDVSFELRRGEVVGFLGRNGAGKSTCLRILTGGLRPDAGTVEVCGFDLAARPLEAKSRMGYLPENNPLYGELTVAAYLDHVAGFYRLDDPRGRTDEVMERLSLSAVASKTIRTLSKGYRQRVGLAQAWLHDPEVLVLDEPFSGLDPAQLAEMHALIRSICAEKVILFSSHALAEAGDLCTRLLLLHEGRIVADGAVDELTRHQSLEELFKEKTR